MAPFYLPLAAAVLLLAGGCASHKTVSTVSQPQAIQRLGVFRPLSHVQVIETGTGGSYDPLLTRLATGVLLDEFSNLSRACVSVPLQPEADAQRQLDGVLAGLFQGLAERNSFSVRGLVPRRRAVAEAHLPGVVREVMEGANLDHAVGFFQHGFSRTPGNFAWESVKTAGRLALTFGSTGNDPVHQPRLTQALNLSKEKMQVGAVIFDLPHDRILFFNVLESTASPSDEAALRTQVRKVLREIFPETPSTRSMGVVAR